MIIFDVLLDYWIYILLIIVIFFSYRRGLITVPQEQAFIIERFSKYRRTLNAGLNIIIPFIDLKAGEVSLKERRRIIKKGDSSGPEGKFELFTKDNVEVDATIATFYRVIKPELSFYRIGKAESEVDSFVETSVKGVVRSVVGNQLLDEIQRNRDILNDEITKALAPNAEEWGVKFTRTEITDIDVDAQTKEAQRLELEAERKKRATIIDVAAEKKEIEQRAEAERNKIQIEADAIVYKAKKEAEAIRLTADAAAYAIEIQAKAIENNGQAAVSFEILKKQVSAIGDLAGQQNSKTIILPTDITKVLGSFETILSSFSKKK